MKLPCRPMMVTNGLISNQHGYTRAAPSGSWFICDADGNPPRTHDGFAVFSTEQQAAWACEMVASGHYHGAEDARKAIREALGLPEPVE